MTKQYPLHHEDAGPLYKKIAVDEYNRLRDENAELREKVATLEEAQRWRKFSEEKPKHHQDILCYCPIAKFCKVALRRWDEGTKFDVFKQELYTHWMPLPSAPKEDNFIKENSKETKRYETEIIQRRHHA